VDDTDGTLMLGATAEKFADLKAAVAELGGDPARILHNQCCVSLIGANDYLRGKRSAYLDMLCRAGMQVTHHEASGFHCTFVVPDSSQAEAVKALYQATFAD
jgi:hypothetical protein